MSVEESNKSLKESFMSLLSNKPIWVFWIAYSVLAGVFFGIFYTATYFLALRWWVAVLVIIAIGVIWGSIIYSDNKPETEKEKE